MTSPEMAFFKPHRWSLRSRAFRGLLYQIAAIAAITGVVWFLAHNTAANMQLRGIQSGFDFMLSPAGFDIGESLFAFDSDQPYWYAFWVGLGNTLRVALLGIVASTLIGTLIGVGRFSRNALVRGACWLYVEVFRNIPLLLQLLMWYLLFAEMLPGMEDAWNLGPFYLSKGGLSFPTPVWELGHVGVLLGLACGVVGALGYRRWARRKFEQTTQVRSMVGLPLALVLACSMLGWLLGGAPHAFMMPIKGEFAIENAGALTPEFLAVFLGLTLYTAAFIAEVVRGGIASVPKAQSEAASALGLSKRLEMRLILLPQALRSIIPPLTNQYLNLTKNSSLAVAIGYPDVVSVANTAINQTGRAVECISVVMLVYLTTSLLIAVLMTRYNARAAIAER